MICGLKSALRIFTASPCSQYGGCSSPRRPQSGAAPIMHTKWVSTRISPMRAISLYHGQSLLFLDITRWSLALLIGKVTHSLATQSDFFFPAQVHIKWMAPRYLGTCPLLRHCLSSILGSRQVGLLPYRASLISPKKLSDPQDALPLNSSLGAARRQPSGRSYGQEPKGEPGHSRGAHCAQILHHQHGMLTYEF